MRRLAPLLLVALVLGLATSASGSGPGPILGVSGNTARFHSQVNQTSQVDQAFLAWGQGQSWGAPFQVLFQSLGPIPMIHLGTNAKGSKTKQAITPAQIAAGVGDGYLGAINAAVSQWGQAIYVRPMGEMNNRGVLWFTSPEIYRKAFQRIYLIVHGGDAATINSKLKSLGMPPYKGSAESNPFPRVRVLWSPLSGGVDPKPYWPGNAYVDVGGADIYKEASGEPPWSKFTDIYKFVRGNHKPFAAPEWGMYTIDDPVFVQTMCTFLKTHKTETEEFYESRPGSIFDLANKPKARGVYKECITPFGGPPPSWASGGPGSAKQQTLKITPTPASGAGPLDVAFAIQAKLSVPIVRWQVTFGDGGMKSGTGDPPTSLPHMYADGASYQATLTVFASPPFTPAASKFFAFTTVDVGGDPLIRFEPTPSSGRAPLKVSFRVDGSKLSRPVQSWTLLFGDGLANTKTGALPRFAGHTFAKAGKYNVLLVVIAGGQEYISVAPVAVS
ncbi:MAG TPA: hypothetical protein VGH52_06710 [Gaiellaceae bacterium]|jgi:hypothetical protein